MTNEEYARVIDRFANAVYAAMGRGVPSADDLIVATGDLLQAFADRATRLVTTPLGLLIERADKIDRDVGELHVRFDRRQQRYAEIAQILQDLQLQISDDRALLRKDLDALNARDARQFAESAQDRAGMNARLSRIEATLIALQAAQAGAAAGDEQR